MPNMRSTEDLSAGSSGAPQDERLRSAGCAIEGSPFCFAYSSRSWYIAGTPNIIVPRAVTAGVGFRQRRCGGGVKEAPCTAMIADLIDLAVRQAGVDDDRPRIEGGGGKDDRDEGATIFTDDHDAVARPHAASE